MGAPSPEPRCACAGRFPLGVVIGECVPPAFSPEVWRPCGVEWRVPRAGSPWPPGVEPGRTEHTGFASSSFREVAEASGGGPSTESHSTVDASVAQEALG